MDAHYNLDLAALPETERKLAARIAPTFRAACGGGGPYPPLRFYPAAEVDASSSKSQGLNIAVLDREAACVEAGRLKDEDGLAVTGIGLFLRAETISELNRKASILGLASIEGVPREMPPYRRMYQKVAIVTGSAQGFGAGIARELAAEGAFVAIADMNVPLAKKVAAELNRDFGAGTALAIEVNVADEASVERLVDAVVLNYGGLDAFISNAGVLRAGGLEDMDVKIFEFVTKINYTAYFIGTKYASRPMKIQNHVDPLGYTDIIQINSKSGLVGSNRNFAYAGGKFGGIGLTESFAKELVADRIKVNAVCPGNYYEGPLWSDPEKGLFVQYLKAGKVSGAKTIEDVYRFYIEQVPMRKGCSPLDVARAIFYLIEQRNETGQALPVTGGQTMLK